MSLKWTGNNSESGILRKSEFKEKKEELFVFGYSCKLFRDDDRALLIDQGKHLIPWMGDETLKIDRYDARGALHDLSTLEAPPGGFDWRVELKKTELDVEQLCDEERYRALHTDEDEEEMYKEEELKRLHAAGYGQVGFNYDTPAEVEPESQPLEIDEPFLPDPSFKALLPPDIVLPETDKQNVIIEKTAKFIASQGAQMEILIKAKQGDNPQFMFLNRDNVLHPYYMAFIGLFKSEKWPLKKAEIIEEKLPENEDYLHPSLASTIIESAPSIPSIHYKPSADCDYTMLISKMRGEATLDETYTPELAPGEVAPPGTEPLPPRATAEITRAPVMYNRDGNHVNAAPSNNQYQQQYAAYYHQYMAQNAAAQALQTQQLPKPAKVEPAKSNSLKSTGLSLMKNYNTDSDSDISDFEDSSSTDSSKPAIPIPPEDVQLVIDKMAAYVARNGDEFADIVRAKNDPRFVFLEPNNIYHAYYRKLMQEKRGGVNGDDEKQKMNSVPVSFSIKKMKEPDPILPKPALPYESSTDDESENKTEKQTDKQEVKETPKPILPQIQTPSVIPPVVVYKMEAADNNLSIVKAVETVQKPIVTLPVFVPEIKVQKEDKVPEKIIPKIPEKVIQKVEITKPVMELIERNVEKDREKDIPKVDKRKRDKGERRKKTSSSRSERDSRRIVEKRRERENERDKKRKDQTKNEMETEIISLEDNSDDMIDLTGDQSDSKADCDAEAERVKQQERRRRAAEFLKKVGVDPAAAALPTTSLASAMVDTLESLRKKKAEEEEKRRKREKRRHRDKHGYDNDGDKSHRKSKRSRKYRSSDENEESDHDSSRKRKRKKEKKHSSKTKKRRRKDVEVENEEEFDQPLPPNIDLTTTLKELRTSSPTKELGLQDIPEIQQNIRQESSSDEEEVHKKRKKKKEEREYSEGEWSSDSEGDSGSSSKIDD